MIGWFELIYVAVGIAVFWLMQTHRSQPLSFIPYTWLGKGQLFYLVFLWWVVKFNFALKIVEFSPQRLVTEGLITFNAVICTVMAASVAPTVASSTPTVQYAEVYTSWNWHTLTIGIPAAICFILIEWGLTHAVFGRRHIAFAIRHIRFGPDATIHKEVTASGETWKSG